MNLYDAAAERLDADGWIVGRKTMEHYVASDRPALADRALYRSDLIGARSDRQIGICFDRYGKLRPESDEIEGDHLVLVLSDRVAQSHVDALAALGISIFFAGPEGDEIAQVIQRIAQAFGARRLLLEGGGELNGAFLVAGMIDEASTLVFPVVDGQQGVPAIYDRHGRTMAQKLALIGVEQMQDGAVWLRHRVIKADRQ